MPILTCQNPACGKKFNGRVQKGYTSKFCSNQCSADDRKNRPELYDQKKLGFQKGHKAWNAGLKGTKTGNFMIRKKTLKTGNVKSLRFINVGIDDNTGVVKYVRNDRYVWEQANGPVPKGHVIYHKDGRTLNDDLENLECIPVGEALSRYNTLREETYSLKSRKDVRKLIKGCTVNDRRIQKIFFEMTYDLCMGIAMRYAKDHDTAQDILSDGYLKIYANMNKYNFKGNFQGWIGRIMANTAIDYTRKKSNRDTFLMDSNDMLHFDELSFKDESFEINEEEVKGIPTDLIMQEIQNLTPAYKLVFNMYVFEEMSHKEIAEQLGISEGTSKSNLSKAREKLRKGLANLLVKEEKRQDKIMGEYLLFDRKQKHEALV